MEEKLSSGDYGEQIIFLFAKYLTIDLKNKLSNEYKQGVSELSSLMKKDDGLSNKNADFIREIFAISVCYRNVIFPLESTSSFFNLINTQDSVTSIKLGNSTFDRQEVNKIHLLCSDFNRVLRKFGIDTSMFEYQTVWVFWDKIKRNLEQKEKVN